MPDFSEIEAARARRPQTVPQSRPTPDQVRAYLDRLDSVAGHLRELVASEGWTIHRAHLTGHLEERQTELAALQDRLVRGPEAGDALAAMKFRASYLQGWVDALTVALTDAQDIIQVSDVGKTVVDNPAA